MKEILGLAFSHREEPNYNVYSSTEKNGYGFFITLKFTKDKELSEATEEKIKNKNSM